MMRHWLAMAVTLTVTTASAAERSANNVLPGCRAVEAVNEGGSAMNLAAKAGYCLGIIDGLAYSGDNFCPSDEVSIRQVVSVIIKYIEARPQRMDEDFRVLAVEAARMAWPCKK